jgi:hypothetical protein
VTAAADITKLLKSTGDYDDDEEEEDEDEDEDEESEEVEEDSKIVVEEDDDDVYLDDEDDDLAEEGKSEAIVEPEQANNEVLAAVIEATSKEIMKESEVENAPGEAAVAVEVDQPAELEEDNIAQALLLEKELVATTENAVTDEPAVEIVENVTSITVLKSSSFRLWNIKENFFDRLKTCYLNTLFIGLFFLIFSAFEFRSKLKAEKYGKILSVF